LIEEINFPGEAKDLPGALQAHLEKREAETGLEFISLNDSNTELAKNLRAIVSPVGTKMSAHYILPKALAEEFELLARLNMPQQTMKSIAQDIMKSEGVWGKTKAIAKNTPAVLGKANAASNKAFSMAQTLPFPGFHEMNTIGDVIIASAVLGTDVIGAWKAPLAEAARVGWAPKQLSKIKGPAGMTLDQVAKAAEQYGIVQYKTLSKAEMLGQSKAMKAAKTVAGLPSAAANAPDNMLKLSIFMNFIEDSSPSGLQMAAKKANKWLPNYAQLGKFEKEVMQKTVPFYGWAKYAGSLGLKLALEKPEQIAYAAKMYRAQEGRYGVNAPYTARGMSSYLIGPGVTAPEGLQPEAQQERVQATIDKWVKAGKPGPGSDEFTMLTTDSALTFLLPIASAMAGGNESEVRRYLFPMSAGVADYVMGKITGKALVGDRGPALSFAEEAQEVAGSYGGRHSQTYGNLYKLITDPEQKLNFAIRASIANNMGYLVSEGLNEALGLELPAYPGMKVRRQDAEINSNNKLRKAVDDASILKKRLYKQEERFPW
jgi:hypothetical protein